MERYITRLLEEWKLHGKIIIAADFDDTLSPFRFHTDKECGEVLELLKSCKATGAYVIIHTACNPDRYKAIEEYCLNKGLKIDCINLTPIELPYGKSGSKPYANIFLDDRAGLSEAMAILESALYRYRGYLESKKPLTDAA